MTGIIDKISGRVKKTVGELTGDESTRRQGAREERKGEVHDEADAAERVLVDKRQEEANLERKT